MKARKQALNLFTAPPSCSALARRSLLLLPDRSPPSRPCLLLLGSQVDQSRRGLQFRQDQDQQSGTCCGRGGEPASQGLAWGAPAIDHDLPPGPRDVHRWPGARRMGGHALPPATGVLWAAAPAPARSPAARSSPLLIHGPLPLSPCRAPSMRLAAPGPGRTSLAAIACTLPTLDAAAAACWSIWNSRRAVAKAACRVQTDPHTPAFKARVVCGSCNRTRASGMHAARAQAARAVHTTVEQRVVLVRAVGDDPLLV